MKNKRGPSRKNIVVQPKTRRAKTPASLGRMTVFSIKVFGIPTTMRRKRASIQAELAGKLGNTEYPWFWERADKERKDEWFGSWTLFNVKRRLTPASMATLIIHSLWGHAGKYLIVELNIQDRRYDQGALLKKNRYTYDEEIFTEEEYELTFG